MKRLWWMLFLCLSWVSALEVLVTQAHNYQAHLALCCADSVSNPFLDILKKNLRFSGKVVIQDQENIFQSWQDYRQGGYDYLLVVNTHDKQKKITVELRSPWQSKGTPEKPEGAPRISKVFHYTSQTELRDIAHQLSDELIEMILGLKGFASHPIAYVRSQPNLYQICMSDLYHENEKIIYQTQVPIAGLSWSPDGRAIAFVELEKNGAILKTIQCHSKKVQILAKNSYIASPVYSSDQKFIYFIALSGRIPQIFQYHLVTGGQQIITTDLAWILDLQPGSDPYHLLVSSERSGKYQIYEFDIISKKYKRLTFHQYPCISGVLNPQRQSLFFCEIADTKSLMIERSFIESRSRYVTLLGEAEEMSFAPYSDLIVYEQTYHETSNIVIKSLQTGQEYVWENSDYVKLSKPCWAPQSKEM